MIQAVVIQILKQENAAGFEYPGDILDNVKALVLVVFENKSDPDKIKASQIVQGLADIPAYEPGVAAAVVFICIGHTLGGDINTNGFTF
jgi:hypothetical protein